MIPLRALELVDLALGIDLASSQSPSTPPQLQTNKQNKEPDTVLICDTVASQEGIPAAATSAFFKAKAFAAGLVAALQLRPQPRTEVRPFLQWPSTAALLLPSRLATVASLYESYHL